MAEIRLEDEDDWVVVRKQKITILVPPALPVRCEIKNSRTKKIQGKPMTSVDSRLDNSNQGYHESSITDKEKSPGTCSLLSKMKETNSLPDPSEGIVVPGSSKAGGTSNHVIGKSMVQQCCASTAHFVNAGHNSFSHKDQLCSNPRISKIVSGKRRLLLGALPIVNQRIKASNLQKRLERMGGLRRYLASVGLNQFTPIFDREKINSFWLVKLTMHKLKDMGVDAVGPRRKLLHAIDCLCQPYFVS